jgi:hypothetical protein
MTWQAYNFHDDDRNGTLDTWYAGARQARLGRPFENRGVIPHYKHYEQPFVRWLVETKREVDYLADADLDAVSTTGDRLAEAYRLIIFPGHHEYVTEHEFDVVTADRNRGGNLMFLSANKLLLADDDGRQRDDAHCALASAGPPRGVTGGGAVFRERSRTAPGTVDRDGGARGVDLRWHWTQAGIELCARRNRG